MTQDIKAAVQRQFGQVAANYSTSPVHAQGADLAAMVQAANFQGHERILDAGCGTGHTALTFAPYVREVVAVDLTAAMLDQGRRLAQERGLTNIDFRVGDVEQLPFAAAEFDGVVSRLSAHHWPHPQTALQEIHRVLRPGSQFILSDIVSFDDFTADTFLQAMELLRDPSHVRDHTVSQWLTMLQAASFTAEIIAEGEVAIDFQAWVQRMATPPLQVEVLQQLFDSAASEVRNALQIQSNYSFTFASALVRGRRR